jgi:hypothetical protein
MTAVTATPSLRSARHEPPSLQSLEAWESLRVERENILFSTPRPGVLRVEITISNVGIEETSQTYALLRSAPLGVFVPWQPLDLLEVPLLAPGEVAVIRREYAFDTTQPVGGIDKLPPNRVLTALGLGEPDRKPRTESDNTTPGVADDLLKLLQQGSTHWAGNLNLFFPRVDVERHAAQALRVYPGCMNLAMFIVGDTSCEYRFELTGDAGPWKARLFDTHFERPIVTGIQSAAMKEGEWIRPASGLVLLMVEPPVSATTGAVNVHVCQRTTNREAVVEFTMDSRAAGPGCYKM